MIYRARRKKHLASCYRAYYAQYSTAEGLKHHQRTAMFSIAHLVIIFVVALVVFGPEKLPDLARNLGKVMGEFRRATGDLRSTFEGHMRDLEREAELRKVREGQAAAAAAQPAIQATAPDGADGGSENSIGGGNLMTPLPLSTPESTSAVDPADGVRDQAPPPGTVQSDRPNAAPFAEPASPSPQQLEFEPQQLHAGERPDSDSEKASDVRSRPA
jgi:sec-independent protein translocase protein TatB